jgi:hypothetical protein
MSSPIALRFAAIATFVLLSVPGFDRARAEPAAAAGGTGDLWSVTTQMSMEGMPMALPPNTQKVCASKDWTEPPGGADAQRKCTNSDFKLEGTKATWKTTCAGPPAMSGEGEIVRDGADAYSGTIKFTSPEGNMTVKLSGKRLGGCDAPKR